ncbi:MAG: nucleotide exchange factor GrpE, partial [Candidatus Moranbacteria bacterium]|nr:nucleotide exchange factor GrpE [Candidatus Moranbacteria bacterium]
YDSVKKDFSLAQKIILVNEKSEVLLVKTTKDDLWDLPGGHFDENDESQIESLKREVAEEIGNSVDFEILDEISVELRKWKGEFTNVKVGYLAKYNFGKIKLEDNNEHSDFKWMNFDEIENLKNGDCKEWLKRVVEKAQIRMKQNSNSEFEDEKDGGEKFLNSMINIKAVIVNQKKEALILKRSNEEEFNKGAYDLVGGYMREGESFEEALLREIKEETGLTEVTIESILKAKEFPRDHEKFNKIKALRFIVKYSGENDEVKLNEEEHESFEWLSFDEAVKAFSDEGFEGEKKESLLAAKNYLEREEALSGWHRTLADFDNYKKRALEREREFNQYASEKIINEMLPVLDNFHSATEHIPESDQENPWVTGIMYIQKQMYKVFEDNDVTEMEVEIGDEFNAEIMEAVKSDDESEGNNSKKEKVVKIVRKGYKIKEKIMRPVKVVVG